ncbi:hypothetical protein ACLOJK_039483 [Asimina triloba]
MKVLLGLWPRAHFSELGLLLLNPNRPTDVLLLSNGLKPSMPSVPFKTVTRIAAAVFNQRPKLFQTQTLKMASRAPARRPFCDSCSKPARLCLCSRIKQLTFHNSIAVTILQHSQEKNHPLNSTRILSLGLKNIAVVPVSDVHFEARFDIRLTRSEHCETSTAADSNGGYESDGECLEKSELFANTDSVETKKDHRESGAVGVWESDDGSSGEQLQSPNYSANSDFVRTHEAVGESGSKAAIFPGNLENISFQHRLEETDFRSEWGSRTAILVTELENGGNCRSDVHGCELHEQKKRDSRSASSRIAKENTHLQSNQKQLEKWDCEQVLGCSTEIDTFQGSGSTANGIGDSSENGLLGCSTHVMRKNFSDSQDINFASVSSKLHRSTLNKSELGMVSGCITAKETPLDSQRQLITAYLDQSEAVPKYAEATIIAAMSQHGFACTISSLRTSRNVFEKSDTGFFSSSLIGKAAIANGFVVKKVQRKPSDCNVPAVREFEEFEITVPPGSALLFPSEKSVGLDSVDFEVKHLIVLDGTWSKAKRMYHENPWLKLLPHLKLDPSERSLYSEVRHQPKAGCLSTIESIVCVLKALGEDRTVLDDLLNVFESMIGDQRRCKEERLSQKSSLA